jgi:tetratricopeptide (TPR) repeat protein
MLDNLPANNYADETQPLFKMLRTEAFRFIVVSYNHYNLVRQLEQDLHARFPDRPFFKINAQEVEYRTISDSYAALGSGFYWIENFDDILRADRDSQGRETAEMALNNERRRHIAGGLNLRRDRWALSPIAMFVLVPTSAGPLYLRSIMEKMPDLWSFRSFVLELHRDYTPAEQPKQIEPTRTEAPRELDKETKASVQKELQRLLKQLDNTPADEHAYLLTLYPQIVDAQKELGAYQAALDTLRAWYTLATEPEKAAIAFKKGELYTTTGALSDALTAFKDALDRYSLQKDQLYIARCYRKIGDTYSDLGDLDKALAHYTTYHRMAETLHVMDAGNADFKNELAIAYSKLGGTHIVLGNLDTALTFFEEFSDLMEALHEAYPQNMDFKKGLAIAACWLGITHTSLGNLNNALTFFHQYNDLEKELHEAFPQSVEFKNGLAISYEKLGSTHSSLGNLDSALTFFEQYNDLEKALHEAFPQNVEFKNGLAISYEKLGSTHSSLGNLDSALTFFQQYNELEKELHESFPQNVEFKNGLAISYSKLGETHTSLGNLNSALTFFEKDLELSKELHEAFPQNVEFKKGLATAYEKLGETHTALGNLDSALTLFEEFSDLTKELHEAFLQNVDFKNGLAVSYSQLGRFYRDKKGDSQKAKEFLLLCHQLWKELSEAYPAYQEFKNNFGWAQQALADLDK